MRMPVPRQTRLQLKSRISLCLNWVFRKGYSVIFRPQNAGVGNYRIRVASNCNDIISNLPVSNFIWNIIDNTGRRIQKKYISMSS